MSNGSAEAFSGAGDENPGAFEAEWRGLAKRLERTFGSQTSAADFLNPALCEERFEDARALRDFATRYRARLEAMGLPVEAFLSSSAKVFLEFLQAGTSLNQAQDQSLVAQAKLAETRLDVTKTLHALWLDLERQWPNMSPELRAHWQDVLDRLRENMEQWLSEIPLEERQHLDVQARDAGLR